MRSAAKLSFLLVFALLVGAVAPVSAKPTTSATDALRDANAKLRKLLGRKAAAGSAEERQLTAEVTTALRELFDIAFLAERALVDHWKDMTPAQRTGVTDTLREVVERNYLSQLRTNLDYEIVYKSEEAQGADVVVHTVIKATRKGRPAEIRVDYVLHDEGNHWRVYDVITDDVSLLKNYRSQFNRIIAKDGVDGLIKRMKAKLDKAS
jgi:phospholipid transport system substrate-binding protein